LSRVGTELRLHEPQRGASSRGVIAVMLAATAFATSGTVIKHLTQDYGLPPLTLAAIRLAMAVVGLLVIVILSGDRSRLRVRREDISFFLLFGLVCITICMACWVYAVSLLDVGVATVLNYTSPAWTAFLAWPLLGERIDRQKIVALALTGAGVTLIARLLDANFLSLNATGVLLALATGPAWGLYGILGRRLLRRYNSWTILLYTFAAGTLFTLPLVSPDGLRQVAARPSALLWMAFLALVPSIGGYGLYTIGLRHLNATVAAILATLEPLIAVLLAWVFLGETLTGLQFVGAGLVIAGVITLQFERRQAQPQSVAPAA
jgi:drug/metabolite transporter, DME family